MAYQVCANKACAITILMFWGNDNMAWSVTELPHDGFNVSAIAMQADQNREGPITGRNTHKDAVVVQFKLTTGQYSWNGNC
mmetsp:Transcript_46644/g.85755  ORF Transcript_46644/g.85755 Transcript_46644/m.85755 type:complete len:81 (-) Transcript_46644:137-379(-)